MKQIKIIMVGIGCSGMATIEKIEDERIETIALSLYDVYLKDWSANKKIKLNTTLPKGVLGYDRPTIVKYLGGKTKDEVQKIREEVQIMKDENWMILK